MTCLANIFASGLHFSMGVGCLSYRAVHDGTNAPKGAKNAWRFLAPDMLGRKIFVKFAKLKF